MRLPCLISLVLPAPSLAVRHASIVGLIDDGIFEVSMPSLFNPAICSCVSKGFSLGVLVTALLDGIGEANNNGFKLNGSAIQRYTPINNKIKKIIPKIVKITFNIFNSIFIF